MNPAREILIRRTALKILAQVPGLPMRQATLRGYVEIDVDRLSGEELSAAIDYLSGEKLIAPVKSKLGDAQWRITGLGESILAEEA